MRAGAVQCHHAKNQSSSASRIPAAPTNHIPHCSLFPGAPGNVVRCHLLIRGLVRRNRHRIFAFSTHGSLGLNLLMRDVFPLFPQMAFNAAHRLGRRSTHRLRRLGFHGDAFVCLMTAASVPSWTAAGGAADSIHLFRRVGWWTSCVLHGVRKMERVVLNGVMIL